MKASFTIIVATLLIMVVLFQVQGQDLKNEINLQVGLSNLMRQDLVFSPFIHKDLSSINIRLNYNRKGKLYHGISIGYAAFSPILTPPYDFTENDEKVKTNPHYFTLIDLDYSLGKVVKQTNKSKLVVSGILNVDIQALNYFYGRISSFGYYSSFGLGISTLKEYQINKRNAVSGRFALPMIYWAARSPYLVNDDTYIENTISHSGVRTFFAFLGDGKPLTLKRLQALDLGVTYSYKITEKWSLGASYLFEFIHAANPRALLSYRNSLFFSTKFQF